VDGLPLLLRAKYSITHHRVTLHIHRPTDIQARSNERWIPEQALVEIAMPSPYRRALGDLAESRELHPQ
jgi:hypothetical protein